METKRLHHFPVTAVIPTVILSLVFTIAHRVPAYGQAVPGPGDDPRNIVVKFSDDHRMAPDAAGRPSDRLGKGLRSTASRSLLGDLEAGGASWARMSGATEGATDEYTETARRTLGREVPRLNNYFILHLPEGADAAGWYARLTDLPEVDYAVFAPRPVPPPVPGSFQSKQGYLIGSTNGIAASYAWSLGDSGQNVTVCDFEYWWNLGHQDLPATVTTLVPPGWTALSPFVGDTNHGTAVLGEMASLNNGWGTTGAAYGSSYAVAHTYFSTYGWQIGTAITYAMSQLNPGDVFLVEQQMGGPRHKFIAGNDTGLVPIEWYRPWYDVVVTAVGNGFHVVEAGGNGYQDLDSAVYSTGNGGHWPFLPVNNSGAIVVGAGAAPSAFYGTDTARSRLDFSNYGSRLDLQGWGEFVVTTGYGTLHNSEGMNLWYDSSFAGTSSAAPIVAAAAALVESRFEFVYGGTMRPTTLRAVLAATGLAQKAGKNPLTQKIGPLPDLNGALAFGSQSIAGGTYQVGVSRTFTDLGAVAAALTGRIVLGNLVFELQGDYLGSATETYPIVFRPFTAAGGNWRVTIRPGAGVSSRVTSGAPPPYRPVILLEGADDVTFDGRPGGTGSTGDWLIRNTRTDSTGPSILFANGAERNALRFLQVESQCSTAGYGTISFGKQGDVIGVRRNVVAHSVIRGRSDASGEPQVAIAAMLPDAARHDSNEVTANEIHDWKSDGMSLFGDHWLVDSNSLYAASARTTGLTAIRFNDGDGHRVADNAVGGSAAGAGGGPLIHGASSAFTGIALTVDTVAPTVVERNVVRNIVLTSTGFANFFGISGAGSGKLIVRDNVVGDSVAGAWVLLSGTGVASALSFQFVNGLTIEDNLVAGIRQTFVTPGEMRCINVNTPNPVVVARNRIFRVGPVTKGVAGFVRGIHLDTFIDSVLVANNMVSLGFGDTNDVRYDCVYDASMAGGLRVHVLHNSLALGGVAQFTAGSGGVNHAGASPIRLRNNAVSNLRTGGGGFHHALINGTPSWFPGASDNNVLSTLTPLQLNGWLGAAMSLSQWVSASLGDGLSVNADPMFAAAPAGNLHIDSTVWSAADNAGTPLAAVVDDYDGESRSSSPDVGADEYAIAPPGAFALIAPAADALNRPRAGTLTWGRSSASGAYDLYLDTLTPPVAPAASGLTDTSWAYAGLDTNREYHWTVLARNSADTVAATGSPRMFITGPGTGPVTRQYAIDSGWSIVSIPMEVEDAHWLSLFPLALSKAYEFAGSYRIADTLRVGNGYWVRCSDTGTVSLTGEAVDRETVAVGTGWSIIGSITDPVTVASITSVPESIVTSKFYGYDGGYQEADTILPGEGYWVKVSEPGGLILTTDTAGIAPAARIRVVDDGDRPPPPPGSGSGDGSPLPDRFSVAQNYPNPFNATTRIVYTLPEPSVVSLTIFDLLGREVATIDEGVRPAGVLSAEWDGTGTDGRRSATGVYLARFQAAPVGRPPDIHRGTITLVLLN